MKTARQSQNQKKSYYGKLQVDETSDEIKSNQNLTVFM